MQYGKKDTALHTFNVAVDEYPISNLNIPWPLILKMHNVIGEIYNGQNR